MVGEKGSSKADTLVKVVLVFFISLLSFSVGTFVGKQVSDSDHRRMALEGEYKGDRSVASNEDHASEAAEMADKISEKEVENLTEEFVNKEKSREPAAADEHGHGEKQEAAEHKDESGYKTYKGKKSEHGEKAAAHGKDDHAEAAKADDHAEKSHDDGHGKKAAAKPAAGHGHGDAHGDDAPAKAAEKVAHNKAPTDGRKEERKPQSVLPSMAASAVGKYAVQVASYLEEKDAKTHAADLKGKGFTAFYLSALVNGKTYYRVLVGLFDNMKAADEFRAQLIKDAGAKSAIVQKIVQ